VSGSYSFRININGLTAMVENTAVQNLSINPNPASGKAQISYTAEKDAVLKLQLYNSLGVCLKSLSAASKAGQNTLQLPVNGLAAGAYLLIVSDAGGAVSTFRFIVE
jgi:hypothetical protein